VFMRDRPTRLGGSPDALAGGLSCVRVSGCRLCARRQCPACCCPVPAVNADRGLVVTYNANTLRMAEQALAVHRAQLRTAADKDQMRRKITAAAAKVREIRTYLQSTPIGG
jgi:hypothetical protein